MLKLGVVGIDFKSSSFKNLESFCFDQNKIKQFTDSVPSHALIEGLVILSTCNRVEIYFTSLNPSSAAEWLIAFWCDFVNMKYWAFKNNFYFYEAQSCIQHLFEVASGLKSMVFGENEILGQIKTAYYFSQSLHSTDKLLNKTFQLTIHVGKLVREKTLINQGCSSISSVAIRMLNEKYSNLLDQKILIVGAGVMSRRAIKHLQNLGHTEVYLTNRSLEKQNHLASLYGIACFDYLSLKKAVFEFDIIYCATSAKQKIFLNEDFNDVTQDICLVDIGLPRNVSETLDTHPKVNVLSLNDLEKTLQDVVELRQEAEPIAQEIIKEKIQDFYQWEAQHHKLLKQAS